MKRSESGARVHTQVITWPMYLAGMGGSKCERPFTARTRPLRVCGVVRERLRARCFQMRAVIMSSVEKKGAVYAASFCCVGSMDFAMTFKAATFSALMRKQCHGAGPY